MGHLADYRSFEAARMIWFFLGLLAGFLLGVYVVAHGLRDQ
jgi:hypothetical protein